MDLIPVIVIVSLAVGIGFLSFFLIKSIVIPRRAAEAMKNLDRSKLLQTIRTAKAMLEKDSKNVEAHYLLGKAYLADKRNEQAYREYKSISRMGLEGWNINETEFRETAAMLFAQFNEEEEALKEYVLLIKLHPGNPEYYFRAGELFSRRSRGDLAGQYLRKAVSLNPREARYRFELGMHYYHSKRIKDAGSEFEAALRLDPSNGQALLYLGKVFKDSKDYNGAIPHLEKAARDPEYKLRALIELGSCYISLKMLDKAVPELERAVNNIEKEADSDSLYARYFLAMCYEKKQEFEKAVAQWEKIYAQKKNFRDVGEKLTQYIEYRYEGSEKDSSRRP